jgi:hypothetical protein
VRTGPKCFNLNRRRTYTGEASCVPKSIAWLGTLPTRPADPPRTGGGRLDAGAGLFKPVAMGPNEVEDAAAEFNSRVQIVSPPPDFFRPKVPYLN